MELCILKGFYRTTKPSSFSCAFQLDQKMFLLFTMNHYIKHIIYRFWFWSIKNYDNNHNYTNVINISRYKPLIGHVHWWVSKHILISIGTNHLPIKCIYKYALSLVSAYWQYWDIQFMAFTFLLWRIFKRKHLSIWVEKMYH